MSANYLAHTVEFPLAGLRRNIYSRCLDQNVHDLDVGQLELFLRCLNVKVRNMRDVYKTLPTHPAHGSPPCLFSTNQYLCEGELINMTRAWDKEKF